MVGVAIVIGIVIFLSNKRGKEGYESRREKRVFNGNEYKQMIHLPWCVPPLAGSVGSLGYPECNYLKNEYPPMHFSTGEKVPVSCPPDGVRIYETGNAQNPNVYSTWGVVHADDLYPAKMRR